MWIKPSFMYGNDMTGTSFKSIWDIVPTFQYLDQLNNEPLKFYRTLFDSSSCVSKYLDQLQVYTNKDYKCKKLKAFKEASNM